jgi:hypothetical protein
MTIVRRHEAKFLMEIWKRIEFFENKRRFGSRTEQGYQIEGREDALRSFLIGLHAKGGMRNAGVAKFS